MAALLSLNFSDVPGLGAGTYSWKECYTGATGTGTPVSATLVAHDMAIFKVSKSGSSVSTTSKSTSTSSIKSTSSTQKFPQHRVRLLRVLVELLRRWASVRGRIGRGVGPVWRGRRVYIRILLSVLMIPDKREGGTCKLGLWSSCGIKNLLTVH
jgi:hypothetical protein